MKTDTANEKAFSNEVTLRQITIGDYKYIVPSAVATYIMKLSQDNEELYNKAQANLEKDIMGTIAESLDNIASIILVESRDHEVYILKGFEGWEDQSGKKMTVEDEKQDIKNRIAEALGYNNASEFVQSIGQYQRYCANFNPNDKDVIVREHSNRLE